ncbi:MAG: hypothetical protein ABEI52_07880, partial [Halobacteriaceae archaeon]
LNLTAPATVENIGISNGSGPGVSRSAVNISAGLNGQPNPTLDNVIVNVTRPAGANLQGAPAAINVSQQNGSGLNLEDSTILSDTPVSTPGNTTGLNLSNSENGTIANNHFIGFETQINGTANDTRLTQVYRANEEEFTQNVTPQIPDQPGHSQYEDLHVAQSAIPYDNAGPAVAAGTDIYGAINLSDRAADDGDIINVTTGTYNNSTVSGGNDVLSIATSDITVSGAEEAVVEQPVS